MSFGCTRRRCADNKSRIFGLRYRWESELRLPMQCVATLASARRDCTRQVLTLVIGFTRPITGTATVLHIAPLETSFQPSEPRPCRSSTRTGARARHRYRYRHGPPRCSPCTFVARIELDSHSQVRRIGCCSDFTAAATTQQREQPVCESFQERSLAQGSREGQGQIWKDQHPQEESSGCCCFCCTGCDSASLRWGGDGGERGRREPRRKLGGSKRSQTSECCPFFDDKFRSITYLFALDDCHIPIAARWRRRTSAAAAVCD